jgi:hypothetical protein
MSTNTNNTEDETRPAFPLHERSLTIDEFCCLENICNATFYKLQRKGLGPRVLRIPGTALQRITPAERTAWHARMQALSEDPAIALEGARRKALSRRAGKKAVESSKHVSNLGKRGPNKKLGGTMSRAHKLRSAARTSSSGA